MLYLIAMPTIESIMPLTQGEIHVWSAHLTATPEQEHQHLAILSAAEQARAARFHFPMHRQRFIVAHATLRLILSNYLCIPPSEIIFAYSPHHKPYLESANPRLLQFNLSHSHELAVFAFTLEHAIGIDTEKVQEASHESIALRYFSPQENRDLQQIENRRRGFYRLWSRKEAIVKAVGKGLSIPLSSFSVSFNEGIETLELENEPWSLLSLPIHQDYETALASNQTIEKVSYWQLIDQLPKLDNVSRFCKL
jgi:4'-phosphopantetheinyl transferase